MAEPQVILLLDSGALIAAGKNEKVTAIVSRWRAAGAQLIIAAPSLAESIRGGPKDTGANRLIEAVDRIVPTTEAIARRAGTFVGTLKSNSTVDAIIVASAQSARATDILTSDPNDMRLFAGGALNVHTL